VVALAVFEEVPRRRIVVIDDDDILCSVLGTTLEGDGFDVWTAPDGAPGLELVRQVRPDVVILDLQLASENGMHVLVRLRALGQAGQVPVVLLTAADDGEHRRQGHERGADLYLTKPVDLEHLGWHLEELLARVTHVRVNPLAGLRQGPTIPPGLL
jgi:two-component system, OmpR family, response regulator MprA